MESDILIQRLFFLRPRRHFLTELHSPFENHLFSCATVGFPQKSKNKVLYPSIKFGLWRLGARRLASLQEASGQPRMSLERLLGRLSCTQREPGAGAERCDGASFGQRRWARRPWAKTINGVRVCVCGCTDAVQHGLQVDVRNVGFGVMVLAQLCAYKTSTTRNPGSFHLSGPAVRGHPDLKGAPWKVIAGYLPDHERFLELSGGSIGGFCFSFPFGFLLGSLRPFPTTMQ